MGKSSKMSRKKKVEKTNNEKPESPQEIPAVREMTEEDLETPKELMGPTRWTNKQRVLVIACRGLSFRDRHLMKDLISLMPHSKTESKMRRGDSLYAANEMAEMKNCNKCLLFEGRKKGDLYMWVSDVSRGPSAKFQVENVHTAGELKMTGNCLMASRPFLSFDMSFSSKEKPHLLLLKEMFVQTFGIPKGYPKSQPFFDRVYSFSLVDDKIWIRHYQILPEEDGSLAEIGPRLVLNPIKIFAASFSGETLWENPKYVTPNATRALLKKMKAGKYAHHVQSKAAYEASRPKESTYKVDETDEVFNTLPTDSEDEGFTDGAEASQESGKKRKKSKPNKVKRKKLKQMQEEEELAAV